MMDASETMIERVDKAMEAAGKAWLASRPVYEGWADVPGEVFARAAIEAMREPTEAMEKAAMLRPDESHAWRREWQLAIDAALNPQTSP